MREINTFLLGFKEQFDVYLDIFLQGGATVNIPKFYAAQPKFGLYHAFHAQGPENQNAAQKLAQTFLEQDMFRENGQPGIESVHVRQEGTDTFIVVKTKDKDVPLYAYTETDRKVYQAYESAVAETPYNQGKAPKFKSYAIAKNAEDLPKDRSDMGRAVEFFNKVFLPAEAEGLKNEKDFRTMVEYLIAKHKQK